MVEDCQEWRKFGVSDIIWLRGLGCQDVEIVVYLCLHSTAVYEEF